MAGDLLHETHGKLAVCNKIEKELLNPIFFDLIQLHDLHLDHWPRLLGTVFAFPCILAFQLMEREAGAPVRRIMLSNPGRKSMSFHLPDQVEVSAIRDC